MKYGHVGRPTNEEVAARKRKKVAIIIIPVVVIAAVLTLVVTKVGIKETMGNSVYSTTKEVCTCEEGWSLNGKVCTKENEIASNQIDAYVIGDINNDGQINMNDYNLLKEKVNETEDINILSNYIYDVNLDGTIDIDDVEKLKTLLPSSNTSGISNKNITYSCPAKVEMSQKDEKGNEFKYIVEYTLNDKKCDAVMKQIMEIGAVCTKSDESVIVNEADIIDEEAEKDIEETTGEITEDSEDILLTAYRESNSLYYGSNRGSGNEKTLLAWWSKYAGKKTTTVYHYVKPNCSYGSHKNIRPNRKKGVCYSANNPKKVKSWSACENGTYDAKRDKCRIGKIKIAELSPSKVYSCGSEGTLIKQKKTGKKICLYDGPKIQKYYVPYDGYYDKACLKKKGAVYTIENKRAIVSWVDRFRVKDCIVYKYKTKYSCPGGSVPRLSKGICVFKQDPNVTEKCPAGYKYKKGSSYLDLKKGKWVTTESVCILN